MYILVWYTMYMHIYITQDNEQFLRSHSGSMSGLINELLDDHRDKVEASAYSPPTAVKKLVLQTTSKLDKNKLEALKDKIDAVCTGHEHFRQNCGRKGCRYA